MSGNDESYDAMAALRAFGNRARAKGDCDMCVAASFAAEDVDCELQRLRDTIQAVTDAFTECIGGVEVLLDSSSLFAGDSIYNSAAWELREDLSSIVVNSRAALAARVAAAPKDQTEVADYIQSLRVALTRARDAFQLQINGRAVDLSAQVRAIDEWFAADSAVAAAPKDECRCAERRGLAGCVCSACGCDGSRGAAAPDGDER